MIRNRGMILATTVLLLGATACDDDDDIEDPTMASLAGTYEARDDTGAFLVTSGNLTIDILEIGGFVELTLEADGRTSGTVFVPDGDDDGGDFNASLDGTWELRREDDDDWVVELDHSEDTFLRDIVLEVEGNRLEADRTFEGQRVQIRLVRQ